MDQTKFISYAQNFEDVMLWRALKSVDAGFYIDVGANHPVCDSVTHAFYERGWRGVNIEPVRGLFDQLVQERKRDINICSVISSEIGTATFYEVVGTGLSTLDPDIAKGHERQGYMTQSYAVPVTTLSKVCEEHDISVVHFMKVDVEGAELSVLQGMNFSRVKPWILVVEATRPNTQIPSHVEWEPLVLRQGYSYVYFDGANRYYLSDEHLELRDAFIAPPNAFDAFVPYPMWLSQQDAVAVRRELTLCQTRLAEIRASWSWKVAKPLRAMEYGVRTLFRSKDMSPNE